MKMRLYYRRCPKTGDPNAGFGMISAWLEQPRISKWRYLWLRRTSHFGDGHIEAAFFYTGSRCVVYAVKNIANDYCRSKGNASSSKQLAFGAAKDEPLKIYDALTKGLRQQFDDVELATSEQCVALAVDPKLLGANAETVRLTLFKRYQSLYNLVTPNVDQQRQGRRSLCESNAHNA